MSDPNIVLPQPTPMTVIPDTVQGQDANGRSHTLVRIQVLSHSGAYVMFFTAEDAKKIAAQIRLVANQAATGLILPNQNGRVIDG